jgi:hypothetical protein
MVYYNSQLICELSCQSYCNFLLNAFRYPPGLQIRTSYRPINALWSSCFQLTSVVFKCDLEMLQSVCEISMLGCFAVF